MSIALGILVASGQLQCKNIEDYEFLGELALTGHLRPITGTISAAIACQTARRTLIISHQNGAEAALAAPLNHYCANHLLDVCAHLQGQQLLTAATAPKASANHGMTNLDEVKGQFQAKRALEISAAGRHNLLMVGPPGCGKSMLAARLISILPPLGHQQALEQIAIQSVANKPVAPENFYHTSYRSPHHSASAVALVGGGNPPKPGEISLAHHGVLFLDELAEFQQSVLEALREPLESREITISRASTQAVYPADFLFIAAMNPCSCGYYGSLTHQCSCSPERIRRYRSKISGPLLDRIDLHIGLQATPSEQIIYAQNQQEESSEVVLKRVIKARDQQQHRQQSSNHLLNGAQLQNHCGFTDDAKDQLQALSKQLQLSARAIQRAMRVARTIADLAGETEVRTAAILEAVSFRQAHLLN